MSYSFEEFIMILNHYNWKLATIFKLRLYIYLMPYIFPIIYQKLNQNPITFPLLMPIILLRFSIIIAKINHIPVNNTPIINTKTMEYSRYQSLYQYSATMVMIINAKPYNIPFTNTFPYHYQTHIIFPLSIPIPLLPQYI